MTRLRKMMLEELQRRNYAETIIIVILVRKFKFPSQFSFGPLVLDRATKLQNLRSSLTSAPDV
jgi:hypothetical protein